MKRFIPRSLFGQTLAILMAGLVFSHAVGAWFYDSDREQAIRAVGGLAAAQRIANLIQLIDEAPDDWRPRLVSALSGRMFRIGLSSVQPVLPPPEERAAISETVRAYIAGQLPDAFQDRLHVAVAEHDAPLQDRFRPSPKDWRPMMGRGAPPPPEWDGRPIPPPHHLMRGWRALDAAILLSDGQWLSFSTALPEGGPEMSPRFLRSMGIMGLIVLVVSIWAVRRLTRPLAVLADAAERLGRDVNAPPLAVSGSAEMRRAAQAFNQMQEQLKRLIENRTLMLSAISHDLRTPLTLLRLRAEGVEPPEERDRMLDTIAEMNAMLEAGLSLARDEGENETRRTVDLAALLTSLADDMADAGLPVTLGPVSTATCSCRPQSLRRALSNLIGNAIAYGGSATASLTIKGRTAAFIIEDNGPGIPEAELSRVTQPFYRLEGSRNRDTGGMGLGLAITQAIVQSHGGELRLENRAGGGLRASILLPL